MAPMMLLKGFEGVFRNGPYRHRSSTIGDRLARQFYEDLYLLDRSPAYVACVDREHCVVNTRNHITGKRSRRGDGTFGERVVSAPAEHEKGFHVAKGPTADVRIGVEVKILATAMIKQIDRVINDLQNQARQFRSVTGDAIAVAVVGVNHAEHYGSYEGDRVFEKPGPTGPAPATEAAEAIARLQAHAAGAYDEFVVLRFDANNQPPYPFKWVNERQVRDLYTASLQRVAALYGTRFS